MSTGGRCALNGAKYKAENRQSVGSLWAKITPHESKHFCARLDCGSYRAATVDYGAKDKTLKGLRRN